MRSQANLYIARDFIPLQFQDSNSVFLHSKVHIYLEVLNSSTPANESLTDFLPLPVYQLDQPANAPGNPVGLEDSILK